LPERLALPALHPVVFSASPFGLWATRQLVLGPSVVGLFGVCVVVEACFTQMGKIRKYYFAKWVNDGQKKSRVSGVVRGWLESV
jgi:hypothetical protein